MNREVLAAYATKYKGNWKRIQQAINTREDICIEVKEKYITIEDDIYPDSLKTIQNPPWVLFYEGNISLLEKPMVTIVGSREVTEYGKAVTEIIAGILKNHFVIVSGMARGVDGISHRQALHGGHTIGVVGHGLDTVYPKCNQDLYERMRRTDLILSEFPRGTEIRKINFPWRNRILAGLSPCVIVTQATLKSGTMHTVNEAIEAGRDVYCVPYPFMDRSGEGCNSIIQDGAYILYDIAQVKGLCEMYGVENTK